MSEQVYLNGEIVPAARAEVSVFDAGFTHGAGIFETMRVYGGRVMRFKSHIERLNRSIATLEMQITISREAISAGVNELLEANRLREARIRLTATPGSIPRPGQPVVSAPPTILITATAPQQYPPELYQHGMRVCICPYKESRLNPLAGHKTLAYLPRLMALKEAADRKCHESLWFTTDNMLAEGSVCNVFLVRNGVLRTPPLDTPVLPGTVRNCVIELAKQSSISVEERPLDINELLESPEVFLTGSVLEIMPVTAIERHTVGSGVPGEMTLKLTGLYRDLIEKECRSDG